MIQTHAHSDYSTLDGACTCTQRAERAVELGQWALALTDHGVLNGIPSHIKACEKVGIMPILGMEAYYRPDRFIEHTAENQYKRWHLILIAQDLVGWHNLMKLSSESFKCVTPNTRVLTSDLRWVPAGELEVEDRLVGFAESGRRQIEEAIVTHTGVIRRHVYRIFLSDGTQLECSAEHPWLAMYGEKDHKKTNVAWKTAQQIWDRFQAVRGLRTQAGSPPQMNYRLARYFHPWETLHTREAGYIAGLFDGEGFVCPSGGADTGRGGGLQLGMAQNLGTVMYEAMSLLRDVPHSLDTRRKCAKLLIRGGRQIQFKFLGEHRPHRLLENFERLLAEDRLGILHKIDGPSVVGMEDLGEQDVVALSTSTQTYIAEGFGAHNSGFYQNACVDDELLALYSDGIACTTSCILGPLTHSIETDNGAGTKQFLDKLGGYFPGRFYIEIQPHDFDRQRLVNPELVGWARREGYPVIAGIDSHYDRPGKEAIQKVMVLIGTNSSVAKAEAENRARLERGDEVYELGHAGLHMMSAAEVAQRFAQFHPSIPQDVVDEAISNTDTLASSIAPFMMDRRLKMPRVVESQDEAERLVRAWCRETMDRLGLTGNEAYESAVEYECSVIRKRKNFDYIYLVGLIVRWARSSAAQPTIPEDPFPMPKRPMRVGSSRGSAGGSVVCYLSGITSMDPIKHKLSFERFLNVDRKGLPDIDVDFPSDRRDEVKEFAARLLGRENVADVAAFSRFTCRAAIKDVARILGEDGFEAQKVTDLIDPVHDEDLAALAQVIPQLGAYAKKHPNVWEIAVALENGKGILNKDGTTNADPMIKGISKHAGGMILMPEPVRNFIPTIRTSEKDPTHRTAWSETPRFSIVDEFGLVKADLLSLQGLEQQDRILALIAARTGVEIDLDDLEVVRDPNAVDERVMQKFREGENLGVNQFEADGVTAFMRSAQPRTLTDLAAINALYRPGPMGSGGHERFARRSTGREPYSVEPILDPILGDTHGVLAFQEQVMGLFQVLADYTPSQADDVRKVIAKLYREKGDVATQKLNQLLENFMAPATEKIGEEAALMRRNEIPPYSGYSFNRAHASGYALMAYQDMWLKVYYPAEFYAVLMSLEPEKAPRAVKEAAQFGMTVAGPDVNLSDADFTVNYDTNTIRFGLEAIKNVGEVAAQQIVEQRKQNGYYESLTHFDFTHTFKGSKCNAGHRKALLAAGALDSLGGRADWSEVDKAVTESERLGIALRPGGTFGDNEPLILENAHTQDEIEAMQPGSAVVVAGIVTEVKQLVTKKGRNPGQQMARVSLRFGLDTFSITFFPNAWQPLAHAGHYFPALLDDPTTMRERIGWKCTRDPAQPNVFHFEDGYAFAFDPNDFLPLIQKDRKLIIRGKVDDRKQVIGAAVMSIEDFIASQ
jgi:DNA-directed DNA polymerase III PolC